MLKQIKQLGADTAVYGISTILGRFLNFLLVPFYTNVLLPGEYGIVSYIYSLIAFANVVYLYGMETAYLKFASSGEAGAKRESFSSAFLSLGVSSVGFSLVILAISPFLMGWLDLPDDKPMILYCTVGMLLFDTLAAVPFASLRLERRAKLFALLKLGNIVVNVGMNILLLVFYNKGVEGIFISGVVASGFTAVVFLPFILKNLQWKSNFPLWKSLVLFGLPSVPAGLAGMVLQVFDRPILKALTDSATVGIYQANYRLGIFMMLIVSMFDYAWKPFMFAVAKEEQAKEIFARVLTYLTLIMSAVFLFISFFIDDIVRITILGHHLINERYWGGLEIVPIVLLGYVFLGMATTMSAGIYIEKKTQYNPPITMTSAVVNISVNFLLIPIWGIIGAAYATLMAYIVMAMMTYFMTQRIYPITYEWGRLSKLALALAVVMIAEAAVLAPSFDALFKILLIIVFFLLLGIMKFFKQGELAMLRKIISRK